jgi:hypothetical protein
MKQMHSNPLILFPVSQVFHESIGLSTKAEIGGASASYAPYYGSVTTHST